MRRDRPARVAKSFPQPDGAELPREDLEWDSFDATNIVASREP